MTATDLHPLTTKLDNEFAQRNPALAVLTKVWRHNLGRFGLVVLGGILILAATADFISPYDPVLVNYEVLLQPPSTQHWFGTDELGRDILSRILHGAQGSVLIMTIAIALAFAIGIPVGLVSGYLGGTVDEIIMRIVDGLLAFPMMILALAIVAILGPSLSNAIIAIALVNVPGFARMVRGQTLATREADFVHAARASGLSSPRIVARHVWPSVRGNSIVYASLKCSAALITESALSFLGLGVQPPTPTWGSMLSGAMQYWDAWWMGLAPGLAIFLTVLALNFFGDALRDALDSRIDS
ncbi:ABC transporter permease [Ensifer sp. ENS05]|uniref:ABC transporter permease n=1 Tax=Ensifer sp. ENS05 TaxID=2769277 RepID=UPI00177D65C7|nr:ABC transporter permease [Ensifer sp. ENS05]MBD9597297.1 ABC transporter permease [Ensifer sp. ENS05]